VPVRLSQAVFADVKGGGVHGATLSKTCRDGNPARARK
jgi:hypothetical protein